MEVVRYYEDFSVGQEFISGGITLTKAEIINFALMYDPQPFHLDEQSARESPFGGLIASGLHSIVLLFRLFFMLRIHAGSSLGGWGLDDVRWLMPLRPEDTLQARFLVAELVPSSSRPDRGTVRFRFEGYNQSGEMVLRFVANLLVKRRAPYAVALP